MVSRVKFSLVAYILGHIKKSSVIGIVYGFGTRVNILGVSETITKFQAHLDQDSSQIFIPCIFSEWYRKFHTLTMLCSKLFLCKLLVHIAVHFFAHLLFSRVASTVMPKIIHFYTFLVKLLHLGLSA